MFYIKNGFKGKILNKVRIFFSNLEPESKSIINKKIEIGLSVMKFMGWGTLNKLYKTNQLPFFYV